MHQEFHPRDWLALAHKVLHLTGHPKIHLKSVVEVTDNSVTFASDHGAKITCPTFNSVHGHGIGFLSMLRHSAKTHPPQWEKTSGSPIHDGQLLLQTHHNFTPLLYPSNQYVEHWLKRQYQQQWQKHIAPFEDDMRKGFISQYPCIVDIQRQLSYPIV